MKQIIKGSCAARHMFVIQPLGKLRQEDHEFEVSLGYIVY
jgi:hypothetical protein